MPSDALENRHESPSANNGVATGAAGSGMINSPVYVTV